MFVALLFCHTGLSAQCANAGQDTIICGYRYGLIGQPAGGTWSYLCSDSLRWVELGGTSPSGVAVSFVAECGVYDFIYTVDDSICVDADTVSVSFEDQSNQVRKISYDIAIQYSNHDCPGLPKDTCGHIQVIEGAIPPEPRWAITMVGTCEANFPDPVISSIDSSTCLATINYVGVEAKDTVETLWTSVQDPFVQVNKQRGEIIQNRFDQFMKIIEGSLMNGLDSACRQFDKCFIEGGMCADTVFDTIPVLLPVHMGGQWGIVDSAGVTLLDDTTDFVVGTKRLRMVVATGARYFGDDDLQFELYERDIQNNTIDLDTSLELTIFWSEEWRYDTTYRLFPRIVPTGQCVNCGATSIEYDTLRFPAFPTTFCPTVPLSFNPAIKAEIFGDNVICEDGFVILSGPDNFVEYDWSDGTTSKFNFVEEPGVLALIVTDANGCTAGTSIEITQVEHADYQLLYDSTQFCENNCADFMVVGSGIRSYTWSNNTFDTTAVYCFKLDDELITVELVDTSGCRFMDSIQLSIAPTSVISAGPDFQIDCQDSQAELQPDSLALTTIGFFKWIGPGISAANQFEISPVVDQPGIYVLLNGPDSTRCLGRDTAVVRLFDDAPSVQTGSNMLINCQNTSVTLSAQVFGGGANTTTFWLNPALDTVGRDQNQISVNQPGEYIFFACNRFSGCCNSDTVGVGFNQNMPVADAGANKRLTCDSTSVVLGGPNSSSGIDFMYVWMGPDINGANRNQRFPRVNQAGNYTLQVIDTVSKCDAMDVVEVTNDGNVPIASAGTDMYITCANSTVQLSAQGSTTGPGIGLVWDGPGINAQNRFSVFPIIGSPGQYVLTITDSLGNCESKDTVEVIRDVRRPSISAGADQVINCQISQLDLLGQITNDNGRMTVDWRGPGITAQNQNQLNPQINIGGTYILTVIDTFNSCMAMDTVIVDEFFDPPTVDLGPDLTINCINASFVVEAQISGFDTATNELIWSGPGIGAGNRSRRTQNITQAGRYTTEITSDNVNCIARDTMIVTADTMVPDIDVGGTRVFGCTGNMLTISAMSNSQLAQIIWSTRNGTILSGENTLDLVVGSEGIYTIRVVGSNGCLTIDSVIVVPGQDFQISVDSNNITPACGGLDNGTARITVRNGQGPFMVSLDDLPFSSNLFFTGLSPGTHTIEVRDRNGCTKMTSFVVGNFEAFTHVPLDTQEISLCDENNPISTIGETFGYSEDFISWTDAPSLPVQRNVSGSGIYVLRFENVCDTAEVVYRVISNIISDTTTIFKLSNAFTPNGDGFNDSFGPRFLIDFAGVEFTDYHFMVYTRWGNLVYESSVPGRMWDGNINGSPSPNGNYMFSVFFGDIIDCADNVITRGPVTGTVTLVR